MKKDVKNFCGPFANVQLAFSLPSLWHCCENSCTKFAGRRMFGTRVNGSYEWCTFQQFYDNVTHMRGALALLGIQQGDRIAIISPNSEAWAVMAYAAFSLNAQVVPMYPSQPKSEWEFILGDCGAKLVFYHSTALDEHIEDIKSRVPSLKFTICAGALAHEPRSYEHQLEVGAKHPAAVIYPDLDDVCTIIYTSGTTAHPKGVMLSHRNILTNMEALRLSHDFRTDDISLCFLPWAHIYGQVAELHHLIAMGFSTAFAESPQTITHNMPEVKPTILITVPKVLNRIYLGVQAKMRSKPLPIRLLFRQSIAVSAKKAEGRTLTTLDKLVLRLGDKLIFSKIRALMGGKIRWMSCGAAALDRKIGLFIAGIGIPVYEGYGLTETAPMIANNNRANWRISSAGVVIPGTTITIDTSVVESDKGDGEIIAYGPNVMKGYYNNPAATAEVMTADGGFRTGDLGYVDDEGFLFITGRIKEQYKLENGKYVLPAALEEKIKLSRFVENAFVYGEGRAHNICIISVNKDNIKAAAKERQISGTIDELIKRPELVAAVSRELHKYNKTFKPYERVYHFALVADEWSTANNLVTQTLKLKRREIYPYYKDIIESLYDPATNKVKENPLYAIEVADRELYARLTKNSL
jgi:long-chain acyl-CoA synthetase